MPEVMLGPMCLAQPRKAYLFAAISLCGSLLGAVVFVPLVPGRL
jgi:membrane protein YqaA with SNARE-associated domain